MRVLFCVVLLLFVFVFLEGGGGGGVTRDVHKTGQICKRINVLVEVIDGICTTHTGRVNRSQGTGGHAACSRVGIVPDNQGR